MIKEIYQIGALLSVYICILLCSIYSEFTFRSDFFFCLKAPKLTSMLIHWVETEANKL